MNRADIERVLAQESYLTYFGIGIWRGTGERLTPEERAQRFQVGREELLAAEDECTRAHEWLQTLARTKTINPRHSSYHYKHVAENARGPYISNGALIAAAIHAGFTLRFLPGNPNVLLNISERSLRRAG